MTYKSQRVLGIVDMIIHIKRDDYGNVTYYTRSIDIDYERLFLVLLNGGGVYYTYRCADIGQVPTQ